MNTTFIENNMQNNTLNTTISSNIHKQQTEQIVGLLFLCAFAYILYKIIYRSNKYAEMKKLNNTMDAILFQLYKANSIERDNDKKVKELQNEYNTQSLYLLKNMVDKVYSMNDIVDALNKKTK